MMLALKKRSTLFALIAVCMLLVTSVQVLAQSPTETFTYDMTFDHDGLTTVEILYDSGFIGSGTSWVAIPKNFTETVVSPVKGKITSMIRVPYRVGGSGYVHSFYDNLTFSYASSDEPFSMRATFNMSNGAMIVEPNGFFFSPQIGTPASARVKARLVFPDGVESLSEIEPNPIRIDSAGSRIEAQFNLDPESRIAVTFKVSWAKQTSHLHEDRIDADVPSRYAGLGEKIVALYRNAVPLMNDLFNDTLDRIMVRFFAPLSLPDLSVGGYTPMDPTTFQAGAIYLNLFYFRASSGIVETIAIHELTHQYEAKVGISPDLLWIHEGLANYVAIQLGKPLDYDTASTDKDLGASAAELNGKYGMIQYWTPGVAVTSLFQYYAASYHVFKTLGNEYGGLTLCKDFFRGLHALKRGLRSTNVAVHELGLAAKANLFPQFNEWGFDLLDITSLSARIAELRARAAWYGPFLPFREETLNHLDLAEGVLYSTPEAASGHITIAAFYIETVPVIIAGIALMFIILGAIAVLLSRRSKTKQSSFTDHTKS
jgi:hypothetical protein